MDGILSFLDSLKVDLLRLSLCAFRPMGMLLTLPIFLRGGLPALFKAAIAISLVLPVYAHVELDQPPLGFGLRALGLAVKELVYGLVLGIILGIPFWKAQAVGEAIDNQLGISSLTITEPATNEAASPTAILLSTITVTAFFMSGGLNILCQILYESYAIFPVHVFTPSFQAATERFVIGVIPAVARHMVVASGPFMILLFVVDLSMLLLGKGAEKFQIFDLSLILKCIIYAIVLPLYIGIMIENLGPLLLELRTIGQSLRGGAL
jgi:type III secretion protein T